MFSSGKLSGGFSAEKVQWLKRAELSSVCTREFVILLFLTFHSSFSPFPAEEGIPLPCAAAGMPLALEELIQFARLVLVNRNPLPRETNSSQGWHTLGERSSGEKWGQERAGREVGGNYEAAISEFCLAHCWGVSHLSTWEGWSRKDKCIFFFTILFDPAV